MGDMIVLLGGMLVIVIAVMAGMIFSFLAGARVYRAGRENAPVNVVEFPRVAAPEEEKKPEKEENWDNG